MTIITEDDPRFHQNIHFDPPAPPRALMFRQTRNKCLQNSDWTQLPDTALSDDEKKAWSKYRQELRDLPSKEDYTLHVGNEGWPLMPGEAREPVSAVISAQE